MGKFLTCLDIVLRHEGGYSDDVHDRGGETKYGISQRAYPHLNIKALTKEQAASIYHSDYWLPSGCEHMEYRLALVMFDAAVNHGPRTAAKMLQRVVGVNADGIIGPNTIAAITNSGPKTARQLLWHRAKLYARIVQRDRSQVRFVGGWINRLAELADEID